MDYNKLIERLYQHDKDYGEGRTQDFFRVCLDCKEAATALSTLQVENQALRNAANGFKAENEKLRGELEQVKAERDAAISDLETIMAYGGGNLDTCQYCKNGQCYARGGTKLCLPQWRGQKED